MNDSWFGEQDRILSDINITPLVDVSLVLLIIFMITAPMMVQGADVRLPQTQPMESLPDSQLVVSVTADGQILIDGEPIARADFEARISSRITPSRTNVQLHGDASTAYGTVMEVMAVLQRLGANIGMVIDPLPERR